MDDEVAADIAYARAWRDEHTDPLLRHRTMPANMAWAWGCVDTLLRELDRRIDPDDLNDEQTAVYEAGYARGQQMMAQRLRQWIGEFERLAAADPDRVGDDQKENE